MRSGKNKLNVPSDYVFTRFKEINVLIPAGTYHITNSFLSSSDGSYDIKLVFKNNSISTWLYNDRDTTITLTTDETTVCLYSKGSYASSEGITATIKDLMISKEGGDYEQYGASSSPNFPSPIKSVGESWNKFDGEFELGNINSSGNAEHNNTIRTKNYISVEENNVYSIFTKDLVLSNSNTQIFFYDKDNNYISDIWRTTFTTPANCKFVRFKISSQSNTNIKVQLVEGTEEKPYRPFGYNVFIEKHGRNLCSDRFKDYISAGYGYRKVIDEFTKTYLIMTISDKDTNINMTGVYFGLTMIGSNADGGVNWIVNNGNITGTAIIAGNKKYILTNDKKYFSFYPNNKETFDKIFSRYNIEIELSDISEADDYEPYFHDTYTIPLSAPLRSLTNGVHDTLEKDGIHRRVGSVVLDGSESNWSLYQTLENVLTFRLSNFIKDDIEANGPYYLCSHFKNTNNYRLDEEGCAFGTNGYFNISKSIVTNLEEWKAWLQANPITVNYELAEPVTEELTEEQLEVINSITTEKGTTYFTNADVSEMEIEYYKDLQLLFNKVVSE